MDNLQQSKDSANFHYSRHFVENRESADKIVPIVLMLMEKPRMVIDVGGGTGAWCSVFKKNGVERVLCFDDPQIQKDQLLIEKDEFIGCDLSEQLPEPVPADLVLCLEVVEHLDESRNLLVVDFLTRCADLILFSAAIPGQPDIRHINEHPPLFWRSLFERKGYQRLDVIRPHIINDETISYWYRQNLFLFANEKGLRRLKSARAAYESLPDDFELVHKGILETYRAAVHPPSVRRALRQVVQALRHVRARSLAKGMRL
jgi:hypothetical protein